MWFEQQGGQAEAGADFSRPKTCNSECADELTEVFDPQESEAFSERVPSRAHTGSLSTVNYTPHFIPQQSISE